MLKAGPAARQRRDGHRGTGLTLNTGASRRLTVDYAQSSPLLKEQRVSDVRTAGEADELPRRPIDAAAYERRSREGPCFVCETLAGNPDYPHDLVWADDDAVAFLARYNTLLGHTLVAPRTHREQVTDDFGIEEYLSLHRLIYKVGEALRRELPTERLYIMSLGSQSGNRHVHWHVAPLPPGVPYEQQQFGAFSWDRGILTLPDDEMAALARRIGARVEAMQTTSPKRRSDSV